MLVRAFFILINKGSHEFSLMFGILLFNSVITSLRFGMANRFEYLLKSREVVIAASYSSCNQFTASIGSSSYEMEYCCHNGHCFEFHLLLV